MPRPAVLSSRAVPAAARTHARVRLSPAFADPRAAAKATETSLRLVLVNAALQPLSYLIRVKTPAEAKELLAAINGHIPQEK